MTRWGSTTIFAVLAAALVALAGCARPNRTATLNQVNQISGPAVATTLEQTLAKQGLQNAKVSCAHTLLINVGMTTSCTFTNAGSNGRVTFTFNDSSGQIVLASVRTS
jgi:hypothetical protein